MNEEQRKRTRVAFRALVTLTVADRTMENLSSRDLSLKGLYVETEDTLPIGTEVKIHLQLTGGTSELFINMQGVVARVDKLGMGIDFQEVDLESFFHLRNIIRYNTGDPAGVDDELVKKPAF